jgi:hypothetical protein
MAHTVDYKEGTLTINAEITNDRRELEELIAQLEPYLKLFDAPAGPDKQRW